MEKPGEMPACYRIVGVHHPINQYPPINIAATAHVVIKPLYKNKVLEEKCVDNFPIRLENRTMPNTVPMPNAVIYPAASVKEGKANAGKIPKMWELPARPCNAPTASAAWVCLCFGTDVCICI